MKLSIITCTYNSEKYLQKTINSVKEQKLSSDLYEHVFVDWKSSDNTVELIKKYKKNNSDKNIRLIEKAPNWIYNAMNEWIRQAKWEYLLFLHSDDYLEKWVLLNYLDFIEKTWYKDLYYAKFNAVDSLGKYIYTAPKRKLYQRWLKKRLFGLLCYINQPAVIHKKSLHGKFGFFNEQLKIVADREFRIKLAIGDVDALFYDNVFTNFRVHDDWASNNPRFLSLAKKERKYLWNNYYWLDKYFYKFILFLFSLLQKS